MPHRPSFRDFEDNFYEREAESLANCAKWRRGRKYLFNLDHRFNQMDFEKRVIADRKQRNYLKETDVVKNQGNFIERTRWNHCFPNWLNYRELHMHNKIIL